MSDSSLPRVMLQQPEMHTLYRTDGSYSFEIPQSFMTVASSGGVAGQVQVLPNPPTVAFLPAGHVSVTDLGGYMPPSTQPSSVLELATVQDLFPQPSAAYGGSQEQVITVSIQQAPEEEITPLLHTTLETYSASEPKPAKKSHCKGEKPTEKGEKQVHTCEQCQATFRRASNLKIHLQRHLGNKPFTCTQCSASFVEEKNLKRHMVAHRTDRPHVCLECGLAFVESGNLTRHKLTHSGSKDFVCELCGAAFSKAHHLKDHLASHGENNSLGLREYTCEECNHVFNNPFQLRKHIKAVHSGGNGRPYVCQQCGAEFGWWNIFRRHLLTHKGEKPFVCEKCGESFSDNLTLRQHKRTHARDKTNACHVCDAAFDRPSHLVRHMRVHTGEKPNVCLECGAAFLERNKLARHMRIHSNVGGSVVCELCGARFSQVRHLTHHMRAVHEETPPSPLCNGNSTQPGSSDLVPDANQRTAMEAQLNIPVTSERTQTSRTGSVTESIAVSVKAERSSRSERGMEDEQTGQPKKSGNQNTENFESPSQQGENRGRKSLRRKSKEKGKKSDRNKGVTPTKRKRKMSIDMSDGRQWESSKEETDSKSWSSGHGHKPMRSGRGGKTKKKAKKKADLVSKDKDDDETDEYEVDEAHLCDSTSLNNDSRVVTTERRVSNLNNNSVTSEIESVLAQKYSPAMEDQTEAEENRLPLEEVHEKARETSLAGVGEAMADDWMQAVEATAVTEVGNCKGVVMATCCDEDMGQFLYSPNTTKQDAETSLSHGTGNQVHKQPDSQQHLNNSAISGEPVPQVSSDHQVQPASSAVQHAAVSSAVQQDMTITLRESPAAQNSTAIAGTTVVSMQQTADLTSAVAAPVQRSAQAGDSEGGFVLYGCKLCSAVFNSAFSLKLHKRVHKTRVAVCLRCGDVFSGSTDLAHHREMCVGFLPLQPISEIPHGDRSTKKKPHGCRSCGATFAQLNKLKLHMQFHTDSRKFVCNECGASFRKSTDLKAHVRTHTGDRPFVCGVCGASYTQSSTLSVHMKTHSGQKPHVCKVCGAAFPRYGRLKVHMRCHSGEKPCVCSICGAAFKWSQTLMRHMTSQHGSAPYMCKQCGETFHQEKAYKAHLQVHSGERPYSCSQCHKAFKKQVQLRRHSRVHTGDWPFLCEECGAGFGSAASLKIHMRCHTGEKPFVCEECGRAFRISSHLTRHMSSHTDDPVYVKRLPSAKALSVSS